MPCKITYKGKQYNNDTALQLDVLKDKNLLERYSELYNRLVDNAILDLDAVEQFEQAKKQLFDILPDNVFTITNKSTLLDRVLNNGITFGYLDNKIIYLASKAPVGNAYHEAFHAVFRTFLTDNEIQKYLELAREKYGKVSDTELDAFRQQSSSYNKLSKERLEHLWYEEKMANDFSLYMQNKKPKTILGKLFAKLKQIIDYFFDSSTSLDSLFGNIALGQFRTARPVHNIYRTSPPAFNVITSIGFERLSSTNINQLQDRLYHLAVLENFTNLPVTDNNTASVSNTLKSLYDLDVWQSQFSNLSDERKSNVIRKIAAMYNAVSLDNHYIVNGSTYELVNNTPQEVEIVKANVNNIINNVDKRLDSVTYESEEQEDLIDNAEIGTDNVIATSSQFKNISKELILFFESIPIYKDIFGIGMSLDKINQLPANERQLYLSYEGGSVFNILRRSTSGLEKQMILDAILNIDEARTAPFIDALIDKIITELKTTPYIVPINRDNIANYATDFKFLEHLTSASTTYAKVAQAFYSSTDTYVGIFTKPDLLNQNVVKQVVLNNNNQAEQIASRWASNSVVQKVTTEQFTNTIDDIMKSFATLESSLFSSNLVKTVDEIEYIHTQFRNLGIFIPMTMIEANVINNYIEKRLSENSEITVEDVISEAKKSLNNITDRNEKKKLKTLLSVSNIRNANKVKEQSRVATDYKLNSRNGGFLDRLSKKTLFTRKFVNPINNLLNRKDKDYLILGLANETLKYSLSGTNASVRTVDNKTMFSIVNPSFQSDLITTLNSTAFRSFIRYINNSNYNSALNKLDAIFGKNSKYQYDSYTVNKLFISLKNNPLIRNVIGKEYKPEQLIDIIANNIVLYSTGELKSESELGGVQTKFDKEYHKLDASNKMVTKLGMYSRDFAEEGVEFAENIRNFVTTTYESKSIHRVFTAPVKLSNLDSAYLNTLKLSLKTEYDLIVQEVNNVRNLYNNKTTVANEVFLYEGYNYVRVNDNVYIPVFSDTGAFVRFVRLDRKYNDIGEFTGVEVVEDDNGGLNQSKLPRAFKLFEFKNMNSTVVNNIETAARRNVDSIEHNRYFNNTADKQITEGLNAFHKLKFNNFITKLSRLKIISPFSVELVKTC